MTRRLLAATAVLAACMLAPTAALAADGDDDPSFNGGSAAFEQAFSSPIGKPFTVVAPDGDVIGLAAFESKGNFVLIMRRHADGTPEEAFGDGGVAQIWGGFRQVLDARILGNGDLGILVESFAGGVELYRVPETGEIAPEQTTASSCGRNDSQAVDGRIRADGGSVVLLHCSFPPSNEFRGVGSEKPDDLVQRIAVDGKVEGTTAVPGTDTTGTEGSYGVNALALGPDGRVFVAGDVLGETGPHPRVVVFGADGRQQGFDGDVPGTIGSSHVIGYDVEVDHRGRAILGLGTFDKPWLVARFLGGGGGLDKSFDVDGVASASTDILGYSIDAVSVDQDNRVLATGAASEDNRNGAAVIRFTEDGKLDPTFANGRGRVFVDTEADCRRSPLLGNVAQETDGDIAFVIRARYCDNPSRAFTPPTNSYVGLISLTSTKPTTPNPTPTPTPTPNPTPTPKPTPQLIPPVSIEVPSETKCGSVRNFRIRLRTGRSGRERSPIVSAVVKVNGKRVKVRKGRRWTALVNLKGLPRGRFTVSIALRMADGGTAKETRRYRTCVTGKPFNFPRLVTHPPKRKR